MADRAITALNEATTMSAEDLFAISQGGQAKKVSWETFYTYLAEALDGHGGINSITYTDPASGSVEGTLTITLADGTSEDFTITNGISIDNIVDKWAVSTSNSTAPSTWYDDPQTMTPTNKYLWHYQIITLTDSSTINTDKAVVGVYGDTGQDWHVYIKWSEEEPDADADMKDTPDNWIGIYSGTAATAPTAYTSYLWFEYKGETGDTGTSITSVTLYSSSGLVDTYRVTFSDNTYTSFNVTNGSSIQSIAKTSSSGLTDTYTVTLTNGTTTTFNVVNGKGITSITEVDVTHAAGHTDQYRFNFNDGDTYSFSIYNGQNGSGSVSTVDGVSSDGNQNVTLLLLGQGAPTTATQGALKQRYFDQTNNILYICVGVDTSGVEPTYTWQGAGVTVDSALSTMSTNPVQNAVLTAIIGTATLTTTAQTLTQAVNELDAGKVENGVITEYVETSTTASRAYAVGDHILLNGVRYVVTSAISSGGTITVGTNVTAQNVDDDLSSLRTSLNQLDQNIAYVESGNTASRTYVTGDYISWKGTLYKASTSIPATTAFAVGTNLANIVDSNSVLCGGLNDLKTSLSTYTYTRAKVSVGSDYTSNVTTNELYYTKRSDGICVVGGSFVLGTAISSSSEKVLFAGLPSCLSDYTLKWVAVFGVSDNKVYRMQIRATYLSQNYTNYPAQEYIMSPFTYYCV